ncbi:hypothetical protein PLICBS_000388 [Purpureocillium lilacinum]|nr:hypothetical protein PLICBS_000388 [Purpureocillium lilacinum]
MIKAQLRQWMPLQRIIPVRLRFIVVPALVWFILGTIFLASRHGSRLAGLVPLTGQHLFGGGSHTHRLPPPTTSRKLPPRVSCRGPRGHLLSHSPDDDLQYGDLRETSYPIPFVGSQRELGLDKTWMTADGRYGPYGFGEDKDGYNRSRVDWDKIDWGKLQDECFKSNAKRFPQAAPSVQLRNDVRFTITNHTQLASLAPAWDAFNSTRRTALVVRSYAGFKYKAEDLWNLRSLIVEASLRTGGEYAVVLLVDVQDESKKIFESKANYDAAFAAMDLPPELRSIAVLWDDSLLKSWYAAVEEHRTMWAVNQPLQLFALHYPEFDHYWQVELDQRFTGDAGQYLDTVSTWARNEPRKQALERATYAFSEEIHGTYQDLTEQVDAVNKGQSRAWGPVRIPDIDPIGPVPPFERPEDDEFIWGVGEDADVIVTSFCADVRQVEWVFKNYIKGFEQGEETPRWWCPPAVMRASRTLLLSVHQSQHEHGMSLPSEAVLPTWALWHGLKLSYPPQPAYMRPHEPEFEDFKDDWVRDPARWLNTTTTPWFGNDPAHSEDGLSHGDPQSFADRGLTWWWTAAWPRKIMDVWFAGDTHDDKMPSMLRVQDGKVYIPNMAMHPVKT